MDPARPAPAATLGRALAGRLEALRRWLGAWRPDPTSPWVLLVHPAVGVALVSEPAEADRALFDLWWDRLVLEEALAAELIDLAEPIEAGAWLYRLDGDGALQALRIDAMDADPEWAIRPK